MISLKHFDSLVADVYLRSEKQPVEWRDEP